MSERWLNERWICDRCKTWIDVSVLRDTTTNEELAGWIMTRCACHV